jgi:hypothetical protein
LTSVEPGLHNLLTHALACYHGAKVIRTIFRIVPHIIKTIDEVDKLVDILEIDIHGIDLFLQIILQPTHTITLFTDLTEARLGAFAVK